MADKDYEAASPLDVYPYLPPNNKCELPHNESYFNDGGNASAPSIMTATAETSALLSELLMRSVGQNYYLPLYQAAERGDWKSAKRLVGLNTKLWTAWITTQGLTVLMVAARACQWQFVQKLVELLPPEALPMQDINGCTVLHYVALGGGLKTAKALVRKNSSLQQIANNEGHTPLLFCLLRPHKEMVWYLSLITRDEHPSYPFTGTKSGLLVAMLTGAGFNDITLYLLRCYPTLAFAEWNGSHLLVWLSYKSSFFFSRSELTLSERLIYKFVHVEIKYPPNSLILDVKNYRGNSKDLAETATSIPSGSYIAQVLHEFKILLGKAIEKLVPQLKRVQDAKLQHTCAVELVNHVCTKLNANMNFWEVYLFLKNVMYFATISGIVEIASSCLQHFPDLIFEPVANKQNILHVAIECRQDKIFNLINTMPIISTLLVNTPDGSQNNILHLTAKLAPSSQLLSISGAALQMQRELQWFKEVEKLTHPTSTEETNLDGKTAKNIFWEEHKDLAEKGERWMKDTSNSCMVVSTLIATVVFAAAFTVPGGNASDIGIPIFLSNNLFIVFAISDALALLSSSTSLLMFLSILTARYAQEDFLHTLPKRLIIGLGSLFFSIITMMVAFGTTLFIVLDERWRWVSIPIIITASIPVTIFAKLQLPLFIDMVQSTYGSGIFIKKSW